MLILLSPLATASIINEKLQSFTVFSVSSIEKSIALTGILKRVAASAGLKTKLIPLCSMMSSTEFQHRF